MHRSRLIASLLFGAAVSSAVSAQTFTPTRFTVEDAGTPGKPDVVLIPGLASSRTVWDNEAKLLAPNFRLHLLQINGFAGAPAGANSSGPILPAVVEELHRYLTVAHMHPVVIGHSMGGLLGLMLAVKYPDDARRLVIVDSLPFLTGLYQPQATAASATPMAEAMKAQVLAVSAEQYAAMAPRTAAGLVRDPSAQKLVAAASIASDRTVVATSMAEDMETDLRGAVAAIRVPVLVLYPYDAALQGPDPKKIDALYASQYKPLAGAKLQRIDGSRHFIMYDQPAALDAALEPFLK